MPETAELDATAHGLASRLEKNVDWLVEAMFSRLGDDPDLRAYFEQPELLERGREIGRASLLHEIACLKRGRSLPESCPTEAAEAAQQAARMGAQVTVVLQCYRAGHAALWEAWHNAVGDLELDEAAKRALLDLGSEFMFAYVDRCTSFVTERYERERRRVLASRDEERARQVREILEGTSADAAGLGYDLTLEHLAAIARGPGAETALRSLARAIDRRLLSVAVAEETYWGWLGSRRGLNAATRRVLGKFEPEAGTSVALGGEAPGADGFRRSHREAQLAYLVAIRRGSPITHYRDVAMEALALKSEGDARHFVTRELEALDQPDVKSRLPLRETLRAYFAASQNAAAAAAMLKVHERTVAYRLRKIEERLGCPVNERRAELELALRLEPLLRREDRAR